MQIEFDLTDYELENLKRKIDELDPVAQSEVIVKYLSKNYTQRRLGKKLGKTRDWVAKRVQFMRALDKLKGAERKEVKELVRKRAMRSTTPSSRAISMDVVIVIADFPKKQRGEILSKHPTVAEVRRLIDEYRQSESSEAKLRVLEGELSNAYFALEGMFEWAFFNVELSRTTCVRNISATLKKKVENFIDIMWYKNKRFGFGVLISQDRIMDEETLNERINWLEFKENKRIEILQKAIKDCNELIIAMVKELESQVRQVPFFTKEISLLKTEIALLRRLKTSGSGRDLDLFSRIPQDKHKKVYYALCKAFHPDKAHGLSDDEKAECEELLKIITNWWSEHLEQECVLVKRVPSIGTLPRLETHLACS
jgi:hypothetical protein